MSATATAPQPAQNVRAPRKPFWVRRRWLVLALAVLAVPLVYGVFLLVYWPFTRQAVVDVLQERSVRSVTIGHFHRTYWPPGCVAEDISFLHRKHKEKQPLITIRKLVIKSTYTRLIIQRSLSKVVAIGMHVTVPPSQPDGAPNPIMPLTQSNKTGPSLVIGTVVADGAVLDFISRDPHKKPFRLVIDRLALDGVGNNRALSYRAKLSNSIPPGEINSSGVFGPWNADNPSATPVSGSYAYAKANLAIFGGLSGTLSSSGKFTGTLGRMNVSGTATVPNFHLSGTSHTTLLATEFQAAVDATDGNTTLENVTAHFDSSTVVFKGAVTGHAGENGMNLSLDLSAAHARIEDLLDLFIGAKRAPMTGNVTLRAHVEVPPTSQEFVRKLRLTGDFGVDAGKFTDAETQTTIDRLSEGATKEKKSEQEQAETVLSDLKGHASVNGGVATLSGLSFRVPGATAWMHGTYGLTDPYAIDLHGKLLTDKPSATTTGFKSFLLKAMTPFLKKKGKERVVPFKMTGTYEHTAIGLDLGGLK